MDNMKSLADQLREQMQNGEKKKNSKKRTDAQDLSAPKSKKAGFAILELMNAFDNSDHKTLVHPRFDSKTVDLMNKFKMATNVDVTKFVAFAVKEFFDNHPEIKTIIKQYIQNTDL